MKITRLDLLVELHEQFSHNLLSYSKDYMMTTPKLGYENQFTEWHQKLELIKELLEENENSEVVCSKCGRCGDKLEGREFCHYRRGVEK